MALPGTRVLVLGDAGAQTVLTLSGAGRARYAFAPVGVADAADVAATVAAYRAAPAGWIEDARACGSLRLKLLARVPAP